jgi:GT2 family glycosyltransferase
MAQKSIGWIIGRPFCGLAGLVKRAINPLLAEKRLPYTVSDDLTQIQEGSFRVIGKTPRLHAAKHFRAGIYLFKWEGSATRRVLLKLHPDYGPGTYEIDTQTLGYVNVEHGSHQRFVRVKRNAYALDIHMGDGRENLISLDTFTYVRLSFLSSVRVGLTLISEKTGQKKSSLFWRFAKLSLSGRRHEVMSHFAGALKDYGEGKIVGNDDDAYIQYIHECEPNELALQEQVRIIPTFSHKPLISIVVPVYNTNRQMLIDLILSVQAQTYPNWELCLADGHSNLEHVAEVLREYAAADKRLKFVLLDANYGIVGNSNAALELATGEYVSLLDHDDLLPPWALFSVVSAINDHDAPDVLYSDEDKITFDGTRRFSPHFKPDWSPDLLRSCNYITHLFTAKRELILQVGAFKPGYDGSQDYDLILRVTEKAGKIVHIPEILYHWRSHSESTAESAGNKMYAYEAGIRALSDHLKRIGYEGTVTNGRHLGFYTTTYKITAQPLVSIIIPNYEHLADLRRCMASIYKHTSYKNYEVIIVENNSTSKSIFAYYEHLKAKRNVRVITWEGVFNYAAINNFAVPYAKGEMLLFLNNDTEVISPDWIEQMLQHAQREEIGAVGAKLYYADHSIQHGGVILGFQGLAGHAFSRLSRKDPGYMGRAIMVQDVSAVTAACMMIRKSLFEELHGFDENLKVAFNDVDLCMQITQTGKRIIFNPNVELYHHESVSRGAEETRKKMDRFVSEITYFRKKWKDQLASGDPYYNPHLDLDQTPYRVSGK